jgi:pyruvate formate lyase activating enzyme
MENIDMKEALFLKKIKNNKVKCLLCPHNCTISEGQTGVCNARKNIDGTLYSLNYGEVTSIALDPIEKKPLYHFFPGSYILSIGTFGCNFKCSFCQNWSIAQEKPGTTSIKPEDIVRRARNLKPQGNIGIAFTYNEPSIWYEFVFETLKLARQAGLETVLVSNGFIEEEPLRQLLPYVSAMNIDVKAFTEKFYHDVCKGKLEDVKRTVEIAVRQCHVEVTTLVIPGLNDGLEEISQLARWLAYIDKSIPLHLSRFFPNYQMQDVQPTPVEKLRELKAKCEMFLNYVYLGNV